MTKMNNIRIGVAKMEIPIHLDVGYLTSSKNGTSANFQGYQTPLMARAIAFTDDSNTSVLISLDLIGLSEEAVYGWTRFKQAIAGTMDPDRIIITCTHNHSSPETISLSDLYLQENYKIWLKSLEETVRSLIDQTLINQKPIDDIVLMENTLNGFSLQRRIKTSEGITMSDSLQPIDPILFDGKPMDNRIHAIQFKGNDMKTLASFMHVICHPVHEMLHPVVSPDFTGYLANFAESAPQNGLSLVCNGCCADINPPTVSEGTETAKNHAKAILNGYHTAKEIYTSHPESFSHLSKVLTFHTRQSFYGKTEVSAPIHALKFDKLAILFLPGEIFIDTALKIEQQSPFGNTIVVGYAENYIGYVPTPEAFLDAGYETGPGRWSYLAKETESLICEQAVLLLNQLNTK